LPKYIKTKTTTFFAKLKLFQNAAMSYSPSQQSTVSTAVYIFTIARFYQYLW